MKPVLNEKFNLSSWALNHQQMVSFFMLLIIAMGAFCYENLPRNEDPAFTIKTAVVSAQWPGASVTDTTRLLTDTLEKKLQETPWLDYLESETRAGSSVIHVNLRDDTPPQKVPDIWYQVRKKMQDIAPSLPEGVQGPAVDDEFDDTYGTIYGFIPEGYTLREVRDRVETIRRELMSLPDIGKTSLLGEQQEQIVLSFSPARLAGMGLNIQQVADALRAQNAVVPAGMIRTGQENMAIKVSGELTSEASLRAVTLHINDRYLPLTDIATVSRENAEPPQPVYRVNGKPAIGLAISMAPTGNMLRFGAALNAKMQAISVTREVNQTAGEPERVITLKVNQTAARAAGVSSESLARMLNTVWSGSIVTSVRDNDRLVDVVLRARDNERLNLATFSSLTIQGNDGKQIPLSAFATPVWGVDDPVIWRRQRLPFITVQTDLAPGLRAEAVSAALRPAVDRLRAELPEGYSIEEGGAVAESEKGNSSVYAILPVTLVIMLLLLMLQLRNYSRMALAILMAPFGLPGIVLAMLPGGTPMGFVALLGVIALAGMIIRNAVILISEVDSNLAQGMASDAAIIAAAEHRARPICLTACAAILGMIPISHQVFWGPMAYAIIGGLLVATLVTLTVLPASFSLLLHLRMTSSGEFTASSAAESEEKCRRLCGRHG